MIGGGITWELTGIEALITRLSKSRTAFHTAAAAAVYQEANEIFNESQRVVPVRFGILAASGHVTAPTVHNDYVETTIGYGGAASAYALIVHERVYGAKGKIWHKRPTKAKYLSDPVNEAARGIEERLSRRMTVSSRGGLFGG